MCTLAEEFHGKDVQNVIFLPLSKTEEKMLKPYDLFSLGTKASRWQKMGFKNRKQVKYWLLDSARDRVKMWWWDNEHLLAKYKER